MNTNKANWLVIVLMLTMVLACGRNTYNYGFDEDPFASLVVPSETVAMAQRYTARGVASSRSHVGSSGEASVSNPTSASRGISDSSSQYAYSKNGPYDTTTTDFRKEGYLVYHPKDLNKVTTKMPIVTWSNPTFFDSWCFYKLLHLLASYGIVVVAAHDVWTGSGREAIGGIDLMAALNRDAQSPFYNKLDLNNVGATGHSQGGGGTVNAAIQDPRVKASAPLHGGSTFVTERKQDNGPMLIITGQLDVFAPPLIIERNVYDAQQATAVYAVRKGVSHYGPVSILGGDSATEHYVVAWFLLQLAGKEELSGEFFGANCKLCKDSKFSSFKSK